MKQLLKPSLRVLIAAGSVTGFLSGWALLAHAPKPAPLQPAAAASTDTQALPTLEPIPSFDDRQSSIQNVPGLRPSFGVQRPRLRTGGS